jgi:hypothetical protein
MQNVSNHLQLIIAKDIARTATVGSIATPSSLADGEVVITDLGGKILNTSLVGAPNLIQVVQGQGASKPLIISNPIPKNVISIKTNSYSGAVQQVSTIGFNGTSGAIAIPAANETIKVYNTFKSNFYQYSDKLVQSIVGYKVKSTDTVATVTTALTKAMIDDVIRYVNIPYKVERTSNGTLSDFTGTGTLLKVTKGSKSVVPFIKTADATSGFTVSTMTAAVGDVFNFPSCDSRSFTFTANILGTGAGRHVVTIGETQYNVADAGDAAANATAVAAAINAGTQATATVSSADVTIVYKTAVKNTLPPVVAHTSNDSTWTLATVTVNTTNVPVKYIAATATTGASFDLDIAWQGETGFIVGGNTAAINAGTMATITAWGIKVTGLPMTNFQVANRRFETSKFVTTASNFSTTDVINAAIVGTEGSGVYEQVADLEWELQMYEGTNDSISIQIPPVSWRSNVSLTGTYSLMVIEWQTASGTMSILGEGSARKQLIIAADISGGSLSSKQCNDSTSGIEPVLDAFITNESPALAAFA